MKVNCNVSFLPYSLFPVSSLQEIGRGAPVTPFTSRYMNSSP
jgi:hypothetical protein